MKGRSEMSRKRVGECNRCGDCCRLLPEWRVLPDITRALFRMYDKNAEEVLRKVVHGRCFYLIELPDGKTRCELFNKPERPEFCKNFPMEPDNLKKLPRCSYQFLEVKA